MPIYNIVLHKFTGTCLNNFDNNFDFSNSLRKNFFGEVLNNKRGKIHFL